MRHPMLNARRMRQVKDASEMASATSVEREELEKVVWVLDRLGNELYEYGVATRNNDYKKTGNVMSGCADQVEEILARFDDDDI